jgi:hypothetical protein
LSTTTLAQPRRPCRARHPYAVPRTLFQCVCTRRRNCIGQLSPFAEYVPGIGRFPAPEVCHNQTDRYPTARPSPHGRLSRRRRPLAFEGSRHMAPVPCSFRSRRYGRDMPVVVPSRKSLPFTLLIGPGIPTQVVVPSVSLAAVLQGAARTVRVEMPSDATLSNPASVAGSNGPPIPGGTPAGGVPAPIGSEAAGGGGAVLDSGACARAADAKRANTAATETLITRIGEPPMNDQNKEPRMQKVPRQDARSRNALP